MNRWKIAVLAVAALAALTAASCQHGSTARSGLVELRGSTMGTFYTVKAALPDSLTQEQVAGRIDETLQLVNELMSVFDPGSELSRFNRSEGGAWFPVTAQTHRVFSAALTVGALSGGALDITVGPLVDLWGFGPGQRPAATPLGHPPRRTGPLCRRALGHSRLHHRCRSFESLSARHRFGEAHRSG